MFGRKKEAPAPETPVDAVAGQVAARSAGKGTPTPKRRDQVAARQRPLVPTDRKAAREASREAQREQRLRARAALDTGDERYLPARDKGPQRRYARDFVDARTSVGEFLIIAAFVFVLLMFVGNITFQIYTTFALWAIMALVIIDAFFLFRQLKKRMLAKFGTLESGVVWYGTMRALQFRRMRLPKPQVKRGEYPA